MANVGRLAQNARITEQLMATEPPRDHAVSRCVQCWADLSTERTVGMAEGAIPWRAIRDWCAFHFGEDREATEIMIYVIRTLDVDRANARAAEAAQKKALGPAAARGRSAS